MENLSAEIYYFDENRNVTDKDHAVYAVIRQLDKDGKLVNEIWGSVNGSNR